MRKMPKCKAHLVVVICQSREGKAMFAKRTAIPFAQYRRALVYVTPYWRGLVLVLILGLFSTAVSLAQPYISRLLIDDALLRRNANALWQIAKNTPELKTACQSAPQWTPRLQAIRRFRLFLERSVENFVPIELNRDKLTKHL